MLTTQTTSRAREVKEGKYAAGSTARAASPASGGSTPPPPSASTKGKAPAAFASAPKTAPAAPTATSAPASEASTPPRAANASPPAAAAPNAAAAAASTAAPAAGPAPAVAPQPPILQWMRNNGLLAEDELSEWDVMPAGAVGVPGSVYFCSSGLDPQRPELGKVVGMLLTW